MPATSRSKEPSTRSTESFLTSSFSCIASKFRAELRKCAVLGGFVTRHHIAGFAGLHVGFDIEKVRRALSNAFENRRGRLRTVIAGAWIRFIDRNGDAEFSIIGREKSDERRVVLVVRVFAVNDFLRSAGFAGDGIVLQLGLVRSANRDDTLERSDCFLGSLLIDDAPE